MPQDDSIRQLMLRFQGDAIRDHSISVRLFTKALDSVQSLLLHIAESRLDKQPRSQGRSAASLAAECELFLNHLEANCVTAHLALPDRAETLFTDLPDFSEKVLFDTRESFDAYSAGQYEPFVRLCPNPIHRKHVLIDLSGIAPNKKANYQVLFRGNDLAEHSLYKPSHQRIREMLQATQIDIPDETKETLFISAKGMAVVKGDKILKWMDTYDILELDLDATWRPQHISWGDCHLKLIHPIAVLIEEKSENLFVATHDQLEIQAFGTTREEAMDAFSQEFIVLWHEIEEEKDENLTQDAIDLKRKLCSIVESVNLV